MDKLVFPHLAVMSGYRCAGKSTVSALLEERLGFQRIHFDSIVKEVTPAGPAPKMIEKKRTVPCEGFGYAIVYSYEREDGKPVVNYHEQAWTVMKQRCDAYLEQGLHVVIDGLFNDPLSCKRIYDTVLACAKTLVIIDVEFTQHQKNMQSRTHGSEIPLEAVSYMRKDGLVNAREIEDATVLTFTNSSSEDIERIYSELKEYFFPST